MIELKNVTLKYVEDVTTLLDFNMVFNTHSLVLGDKYLGANSILRLIAKLDKPTSGEIFVDGVNIKNIKDKDLSVAFIPKTPCLFNNKTIEKNLIFPLKIRKFRKDECKKRIQNAMEILTEILSRSKDEKTLIFSILNLKNKAKNLNLSEQKILTLVRALVRQPKYVLIEDFFANFNDELSCVVEELLNEIKKNSTIIATSSKTDLNAFKNFELIDLNM